MTVLMSIWRNDARRNINNRIEHLLSKTCVDRWVWVVGDSDDETEEILSQYVSARVQLIRHDTHIEGDDPNERVRRITETYNAGFDCVLPSDDYWCMHESDLISPPNIVELFLASGKCPVAGWVMLGNMFYDTWAYRKNGEMFSNSQPRPQEPFEVDSFGSCALLYAADLLDGMRADKRNWIDLCARMRERGKILWVDPRITIIQPQALWVSHEHAS